MFRKFGISWIMDNIRNNGRVVEWRVPGWFAGWNREGLEVGSWTWKE
jgi:hypothetical protein